MNLYSKSQEFTKSTTCSKFHEFPQACDREYHQRRTTWRTWNNTNHGLRLPLTPQPDFIASQLVAIVYASHPVLTQLVGVTHISHRCFSCLSASSQLRSVRKRVGTNDMQ